MTITRSCSSRFAVSCFFFNSTPTTEIYTLSLHDALPILKDPRLIADQVEQARKRGVDPTLVESLDAARRDRKSTRLNSSHVEISYAVFCLKKKKRFSPFAPVSAASSTRSGANRRAVRAGA